MVCVADFSVIAGHLYKMGTNEKMRRYDPEFERSSILTEAHGGVAGGHYEGKVTMQKVMRTGLWWPTIHKDSKAYCKACDACQRMGKPSDKMKNGFGLVKKSHGYSICSIIDQEVHFSTHILSRNHAKMSRG